MPSGSDTAIFELEIELGHFSKERAYTNYMLIGLDTATAEPIEVGHLSR